MTFDFVKPGVVVDSEKGMRWGLRAGIIRGEKGGSQGEKLLLFLWKMCKTYIRCRNLYRIESGMTAEKYYVSRPASWV
jgi:hypothetical protein